MKRHRFISCLFAVRPRGSVVVVVLVTLLFASLLLTRLIETSSTDLLIAMRVADRDRLRADAYGAMETTLAALVDFRTIDGGLYAPVQGWGDPLTYAGYTPREGVTVAVAFEDESAKLSLPRINLDTLNTLLVQLGLSVPDAARVADAMFVWMRTGHIAAETATSATVYERQDPPSQPPYRSLRSFDEVADIAVAKDFFYDADGQPKQLLADFIAAVSLYQFNSTNLNSANPTVLAATGWDTTQTGSLQKYLATPVSATKTRPYIRTLAEARRQVGNAPGRNLGAQIQLLRITVTARQGAAQLKVSTLVTWAGQAAFPASLAATAASAAGATNQRTTASNNTQAQTAAANSNTLRYPYTVLELSETSLPDPPPPPDAPAA
ncbi:MAG: hypothetical protein PSU94_04640 [Lacunisphaera sp.]|nr:hypothetical protein [Lacunisphaera sp.]